MNQGVSNVLLPVLPHRDESGLTIVESQHSAEQVHSDPEGVYICPITGEELPCPKCCPLNGG